MGPPINDELVPRNGADFPVTQNKYIKGGFHTVQNIADRDAIPEERREALMHVAVVEDLTIYELGIDLTTWSVAGFASGGGTTGTSVTGVFSTPYDCSTLVAVNELVYISGADLVDKADANSEATAQAVGFIKSKPTTTTAILQYGGELGGFEGLTPGEVYYASTSPGQVVKSGDSGFPANTPGNIVKRVGFARNSTTLVIELDRDYDVL